jgi:TonB family protein
VFVESKQQTMKTIITSALVLLSLGAFASSNGEKEGNSKEAAVVKVDNMPHLCDCSELSNDKQKEKCTEKQLCKYISKEANYPEELKEEGVEGKVRVQFIIEKDGSISSVKSLNKVHPLIDAEAHRVVNSLPCFKPGYQGDSPARVIYQLPFTFELRK